MASRGLEWKVGLVVLAATILLAAGVIYLGQMESNGSTASCSLMGPQRRGSGDGIGPRGAVAAVELGGEGVVVTLKLRPDVALRADVSVSVENMGIMGEKFVAVVPGSSPDPLDKSRLLQGAYSPGLTEAMAQLGVVLDDVGSIVSRVRSSRNRRSSSRSETVRLSGRRPSCKECSPRIGGLSSSVQNPRSPRISTR
jgi:hypothetical protein